MLKKPLMTKKRAQITLYMILGIVLLLSIGILFYIGGSQRKTEPVSREQISLQQDSVAVKAFVQECIRQSVVAAEETQVPEQKNEEWYEAFIESEVIKCSDFSLFEKQGLQTENGNVNAKVTITEDAITAKVNFPVTVKRDAQTTSFSEFVYSLPATAMYNLPVGQNGIMTSSLSLKSPGSTELVIPKGTRLTCSNGRLPDKISLIVIPRTFNGEENKVSLNPALSEFIVPDCGELSFETGGIVGVQANAAVTGAAIAQEEGDVQQSSALSSACKTKDEPCEGWVYLFGIEDFGPCCKGYTCADKR